VTTGCAVVTGAGSGIGAAVSVALARSGVPVVAVSRTPERIRAVTDPAAAGLHLVAADMTDPPSVDSVFDEAIERFGSVAFVAHSVGYLSKVGWYRDAASEDIVGTITALLTSPALVLARAVDAMRDSGGIVCLVSSGAARRPTPGRALYSATKMATNRMVQSVAAECRVHLPPIGVCAVEPGRVDTPMQRRLMAQADHADPAFGLDRFRSDDGLITAAAAGEAIADLSRRHPTDLNGRIFRLAADGWVIAEDA
jgi:NAD(P)-dependent dehydrogenase (short-subunit alcohol dehydrogenase family)